MCELTPSKLPAQINYATTCSWFTSTSTQWMTLMDTIPKERTSYQHYMGSMLLKDSDILGRIWCKSARQDNKITFLNFVWILQNFGKHINLVTATSSAMRSRGKAKLGCTEFTRSYQVYFRFQIPQMPFSGTFYRFWQIQGVPEC